MNSLRVRLLVIIGASLVLLWTAVAAWMMVELRGELRTALDDRLAASARMVAGLALQFPTESLSGGAAAKPLLDVVARDGLQLSRLDLSMGQRVGRRAEVGVHVENLLDRLIFVNATVGSSIAQRIGTRTQR